jgi:hypothetical protein
MLGYNIPKWQIWLCPVPAQHDRRVRPASRRALRQRRQGPLAHPGGGTELKPGDVDGIAKPKRTLLDDKDLRGATCAGRGRRLGYGRHLARRFLPVDFSGATTWRNGTGTLQTSTAPAGWM